MPDVFTQAKRSEVMSRIRSRGNRDTELAVAKLPDESEFAEIEVIAGDAEVFDDVRDNAARHIARMPGERDQPVGPEGIGVMPVAAGGAEQLTADLLEPAFQLPTVPRRIFAHGSGGEDELVAKGGRNGPPGFEQRFEMRLGGLLKAQCGLAPVASVGVAAGQQRRLGNPHAIFILTELNFRERNNHGAVTVIPPLAAVKRLFHVPLAQQQVSGWAAGRLRCYI